MRRYIALSGLALALMLLNFPAHSQGFNPAGRWSCGWAMTSTTRARTSLVFQLALYGNQQFQAAGTRLIVGHTHQGSGRVQFVSRGRWEVRRSQQGLVLLLFGRATYQNGIPEPFRMAWIVRTPSLLLYGSRNAAVSISSSCRRG